MNKKWIISVTVLLSFLVCYYGIRQLPRYADYPTHFLIHILLPVVLIVAAAWLINRGKDSIINALGLEHPFLPAFYKAMIMTAPMMLGYAISANFAIEITWMGFVVGCVWAAFSEEIVYRAFLFGQLFRFGGWGFIPAGLANAIIFGSAHLYQANDVQTALGVFATTALGGMWFAWLYIEWEDNLWIPMSLHFLMNLWWSIFSVGDNALGGLYANIFRVATIAISVVWTIRMRKKKGTFRINKNNLFIHNSKNTSI